MPAAAVIPAPIAYFKVAAIKKLVVGFRSIIEGFSLSCVVFGWHGSCTSSAVLRECLCLGGLGLVCLGSRTRPFTLRKLECSKQA